MKKIFKDNWDIEPWLPEHFRTCLYVVREGGYVPIIFNKHGVDQHACNLTTDQFFGLLIIDNDGTLRIENIDFKFKGKELKFPIARNGQIDRVEFMYGYR